ncbi:MAG: hypothetical protein Q9167_000135 [Letrouitia subvulpina]
MDVDDDDGYSDDDLDAIPHDELSELQNYAIRSTQQKALQNRFAAPTNNVVHGSSRLLSVAANSTSKRTGAIQDYGNQPSSDYGDFDEEMQDGEIFDAAEEPGTNAIKESRAAALPVGEVTQREQWRQQRYAGPQYQQAQAPSLPHLKNDVQAIVQNQRHGKDNVGSPLLNGLGGQPDPQADVVSLRLQLQELREERDALFRAREEAEEALRSKTGEIAIIRANQTKSEKYFEQKMNAVQRGHEAEAARQRLETEKTLAEKEKIAIEKRFLQNDIAESNEQIKNLQRAAKTNWKATTNVGDAGAKEVAPQTPRKYRSAGVRDGFEDDEIEMVSPSKLAYRSKLSTPKVGAKRKRAPANASPAKPLQLSQANGDGDAIMQDRDHQAPSLASGFASNIASNATVTAGVQDRRFQLTQRLLNHRFELDGKRSLEALADFAFPNKSNVPISSLFLDQMATLQAGMNIDHYPVDLALIVASLWKQCVDEKYWSPVYLLNDLASFIFIQSPTAAPSLIDDLVHVIQSTADVNVMPRVRRQLGNLDPDVSTIDCLELLSLMASDCASQKEDITRFWKCMRFDFVAMVLSIHNPIEELHVTLALLRTSVLENTFAMVVPPNDGKQEPSEINIIDLLTRLLVEVPKATKDEEPYDAIEISELRLDVLGLIGAMCSNDHSSRALASSPHAIGRLVWLMNDELDALYDHRHGHELKTQLVNKATRLVFRLRTTHPKLINIHDKLKVVPGFGGVHKHLIALTRLALSEGVYFEEGIEDDVVDCAYEMLEDLSSPEEAEALREAFSTARSR